MSVVVKLFNHFRDNNIFLSLAASYGHLNIIKFLCEEMKKSEKYIKYEWVLSNSKNHHIITNLEHFRDYGKFLA